MNLNKCWVPLFYDKFSGDHNYNNPRTSSKNINYIFDNIINDLNNKMEIKSDLEAINFYNNYFKDFISIGKLDEELYKIKCYIKYKDVIDKEIFIVDEVYTIIFINSIKLEYFIDNKIEIYNIKFLKMLCRFHIKYTNNSDLDYCLSFNSNEKIKTNLEKIINTCMKPSIYNVDEKIEQSENILFELFEYQKYSIKWMLNKENNKSKIRYNINEEVIIGNIFFDIYKQIFYKKDNKKELVFHGGCIIDEVGLGKTVQITALSILNRAKNTNYFFNEYTFRSKATLIVCPSQLCGQWKRELISSINKNYQPVIISILTKRHFDKYTYKDLLDADFIILSFSFLNNKHFISAWTNSKNPYSEYKYNYENVHNLFVNMGKQLLLDPLSSLNNTKVILPIIQWHRIVIDEFHDVYSNKKYSYVKYILNHLNSKFKWCVTATPFTIKENLFKMVNFLTNYTCFHKEKVLLDKNIVDFLCTNCFRRNTKESVKQEYKLPPIEDKTIWLNFTPTERAMYNAYLANPNNSEFSVYLRQLCCHPNLAYETKEFLSQCKTLEDIEKMMVIHYQKEVEKANKKVVYIQKKINLINEKIEKKQKIKKIKKKKKDTNNEIKLIENNELDEELDHIDIKLDELSEIDKELLHIINSGADIKNVSIKLLNDLLIKFKNKLMLYNKDLSGKQTTLNFYTNVISRIRNTCNKNKIKSIELGSKNNNDTNVLNSITNDINDNEICPICMEDITEDNLAVTMCGHIFCYECINIVVERSNKCPNCRNDINKNKIFKLNFNNNIDKQNNDNNNLINKIGTKLANLILFLKKENKHTIIFSQWDDLLVKIGKILKKNKIDNVFCKGNCYQRDKAIRNFNQHDNIKVIMLSSDSTASGTNLTKAKQIIFIDPIYGDINYRKNIENQAIGRSHRLGQTEQIKIVRFVIKNTVEETIYKQNICN